MPRPEVFLSHASADAEAVKAVAVQLKEQGVPIWLDQWNLVPGDPWVDALGQALKECSGCIVFLGPGGAGPWHHEEVRAALDLAARDAAYRLVPVLLPGAERERLSQLPSFLANRTWVDFAKEPDAIHRLVCGIRGVEPGAPDVVPAVRGRNPYRGLRVFDVEDAPMFFGREVLTQELLDKLGRGGPRFISIVGPSGSGKSSLARAGLLAKLPADWPQVIIRPGPDPLEALCTGVVSKLAPSIDPSELIRRLKAGEEALHRQVKVALQATPDVHVVLLVDQAEEAFTLGSKDEDRAAFFANLMYAATVRTGQTLVVLALRADFYPRFAENRQLAALVSESQLLVPPMAEEELRRAIALPAERSGRPLRSALVDELIADAKGRPASLPLLEHALAQLWERPEPVLGVEEYHSIGKLAGALDARAEAIFGSLTPSRQATCRRLFLRLVQPSEDALDTRRRVAGSELPDDQREVSQAFAAEGAHLLVWSQEFLEVAHEELIRSWGRLQRWASEDRVGQRIHRRLTAATVEWIARVRDDSFLYRGSALGEVDEWLERLPTDECLNLLNLSEFAFLEQSRAARDRARLDQEQRVYEAEASARRVRRWLVAALAMAVLAGGAAVMATTNAREATRQRATALSRELTANVGKVLEADPQLGLLLIKKAASIQRTQQVDEALVAYGGAPGRAVLQHSGPVNSAVFSPDGLRVLTASSDNTARIWDAASGKQLAELRGHSNSVPSAVFSPDSLRVLTASSDNTARIWDAASGKQLAELRGHSDSVLSAVFSPDGLRVLTASDDRTARIWDATSGKQLAELRGHSKPVLSAVFNPDSLRVLTASSDNTARIWDAASGKYLAELRGDYISVRSAVFSPDGLRVLTASDDSTARIWDAASGKQLAELRGYSISVRSAVFSPDGLRVLTASSYDTTARIWDAASGKQLAELRGHSKPVLSAVFSPDGLRILTASNDTTARIWDAASGKQLAELRGHSKPVLSAVFSPDGLRILTASYDNTARIWDAASGKQLAELRGHSDSVRSAGFSPDGLRVLTASYDNTARIWDAASGKQLTELRGDYISVRSAVFSPDGLRVLTASDDSTARIWDGASGKQLAELRGHSSLVLSAAFNPDGLRVLTASSDSTARIWDAASGKQLAELRGHSSPVLSAVFSPDGLRVLTASDDSTARIWDAASGKQLAELRGHSSSVLSAVFSPDGLRALTTSYDSTARVWDAASGKQLAELRGDYISVRSAVFSPDGLHVLTASSDNTAHIWDAASGKRLAELRGHSDSARSAVFSPDGLRVLTASDDNTAHIWDAASGKQLAELRGHYDSVRSAVFSPDGLRVLTASSDNIARIWDVSEYTLERFLARDPGRDFTCDERRQYLHEECTSP